MIWFDYQSLYHLRWITIPIISANGRILRMYSGEHVLFVLVTIVWDEESQTMTNHSSNSTDYDQSKQKVSFSDYLEKDVGCGGGCVILLLIAFIPVAPKVSIVLLIITIVIILLRK